jgi:hypothetical protein
MALEMIAATAMAVSGSRMPLPMFPRRAASQGKATLPMANTSGMGTVVTEAATA